MPVPRLETLILRKFCDEPFEANFKLDEISDLPDRQVNAFIGLFRKVVRIKLKRRWRRFRKMRFWDKEDLEDARTLAISFTKEVPRYLWPIYFAGFGSSPKPEDVDWVITTADLQYFRELEHYRKVGQDQLVELLKVPTKKERQFREQPQKYFDGWLERNGKLLVEEKRRSLNAWERSRNRSYRDRYRYNRLILKYLRDDGYC